jgi:hypothetical protein
MASASDYLENASLKWALTANAVTRPTTWYVALFTTATTDAGGGTEVTGGSYARQAVTFTVTNNVASNSANVLFPTATASWGTISHVAIYDSLSGGNSLFHGAATSSKLIDTGDAYLVATGNMTVTMD